MFFKTNVINYAEGSHRREKSNNGHLFYLIGIIYSFLFQEIAKNLETLVIGEVLFLFISTASNIESFLKKLAVIENSDDWELSSNKLFREVIQS